jgi:hypothetical protein
MMSIDITHICLLFSVFLTINKIRLPKCDGQSTEPLSLLIFMIYMGESRQMSSAIVFEIHIQVKISYAYYLYNCFLSCGVSCVNCITTRRMSSPPDLVIIHVEESSQTICAISYEIQVHLPIETVILFLF